MIDIFHKTIKVLVLMTVVYYYMPQKMNADPGANQDDGNVSKTEVKSIKVGNDEGDKNDENKNVSASKQPMNGIDVSDDIDINDIVQPVKTYYYAAYGKPDPFVPPRNEIQNQEDEEIPILSTLQEFSLDELNVVGIWQLEDSTRKALILTPDNEGVIVKIDDYVGNQGGKIVAIDPDLIKVREFITIEDGTQQFDDKELHLREIEAPNTILRENDEKTIKSKSLLDKIEEENESSND